MSYHYGLTIREYRIANKMTLEELASKWPSKEIGVNIRYVQDVEAGKKRITNVETLRKLASILNIPLWKLGLSEYNPFDEKQDPLNLLLLPGNGKRMFNETLDVAEALVQQTFAMRRIAPLPEVERSAQALHKLFTYFLDYLPPPSRLEARFLRLYAQEQNIQGLMFFENRQYDKALKTFTDMYTIAKQSGDPTLQVHALQKMGVELNRAGRKRDAVNALEEARDLSFGASKHVAAFANAYLGHIYAASGDALHFERAITIARMLAEQLGNAYGDGTDFVFHKMSGILQLQSRGYLRTNQPEKTLALHDEVKRQIKDDANLWLDFRLHLYRARAYLALNEAEACIGAAREFFRDVVDWQSPHRTARGYELLQRIEQAGYGNVQAVKEFREELLEAMRQMARQRSNSHS
jgi:transcriptional regulator with XRE-family HTH domain